MKFNKCKIPITYINITISYTYLVYLWTFQTNFGMFSSENVIERIIASVVEYSHLETKNR